MIIIFYYLIIYYAYVVIPINYSPQFPPCHQIMPNRLLSSDSSVVLSDSLLPLLPTLQSICSTKSSLSLSARSSSSSSNSICSWSNKAYPVLVQAFLIPNALGNRQKHLPPTQIRCNEMASELPTMPSCHPISTYII